MKFSHTLQFNAVPDWLDKYVAYDQLKKLIFQLEKERVEDANRKPDLEMDEKHRKNGEARFLAALDMQLEKVFDFYTQKESELYTQLDQVVGHLSGAPHVRYPLEELDSTIEFSRNLARGPNSKGHEESMPSAIRRKLSRGSRASFESRLSMQSTRSSEHVVNQLMDIRSQLISLYISLSELESYVELNRLAFDKILKKHDKVLDCDLRPQYLQKMIMECRPFTPQTTENLHKQIEVVEKLFADMFCDSDRRIAMNQMKLHLRDQVVFDRNTVWKDMVGQERKTLDAHVKEPTPSKTIKIPCVRYSLRVDLLRRLIFFLIALAVFIILLCVDIFGSRQENYCFALLIFSALLWATEAVPLYSTSLLIPFLIVPLGILRNADGSTMSAPDASKAVFASMFSDTIMMLLGGFSLAAALSKYGIAKAFASHVLSRAGTRPRWVLLAIMFVATFLSMWISNVATPVLCFSLINPILRTLPDRSPVAPCLLLGIALASCIGGMTSPISSPQNIITLQYMNPNPGWGYWFAVALPISIVSIFVAWSLLLLVYRPDRAYPHLNKIKPPKGSITGKQVFVMFIMLVTIALWCADTSIEQYIGDTGTIATIPLFVYFGTGLLNKDDLNAFLWSVVVLAQGGMALGNAVTSSGLLQDIALRIKDGIQDFQVITILAIFSCLILVFATFVSHTVAALIIIPIIQEVGQHLPIPHPNLLVMGAGLACSAGMGLPVSGYPNMSAVMLEDPAGRPYLTAKDFLITGIPTSIVATVLVFTLGYGIMVAIGY